MTSKSKQCTGDRLLGEVKSHQVSTIHAFADGGTYRFVSETIDDVQAVSREKSRVIVYSFEYKPH